MKKDPKRDIMHSFNVYENLPTEEDGEGGPERGNKTMTKHGPLKKLANDRQILDAVNEAQKKHRATELAAVTKLPIIENNEDKKQKNLSITARCRSTLTLIDKEKEQHRTERRKIPSEKLLQKIIRQGDTPFDRKNKNVFNKVPALNASMSQFNLKINKNYDPAKSFGKDGNYSKWDTSKHQLLGYLDSNRVKFKNNQDLIYNIDAINHTTSLHRKFPQLSHYKERPPQTQSYLNYRI